MDRIYSGPGCHCLPLSYVRVRFVFLRGLALIYLIAFASLLGQIQGLAGSHGIAPAHTLMETLKAEAANSHVGLERFHLLPTLAWWSASDHALNWQCGAGVGLSLLLLFGIAPAPVLFLLWCLYLSLSTVCSPFLNFQWDMLLLETGFLAIFFAPLQLVERPLRQRAPSSLVLWLLRWLLFRLMLESGCVKLMSGDLSWWHLTALRVHYETQPLPTWIGWYAHQLPPGAQAVCTFVLLCVELVVPVLIFAGRRARLTAAGFFVLLQILIMLTGNYTFFNWLTILLCVPLLDDDVLKLRRGKSALRSRRRCLHPVQCRALAPIYPVARRPGDSAGDLHGTSGNPSRDPNAGPRRFFLCLAATVAEFQHLRIVRDDDANAPGNHRRGQQRRTALAAL